MKEPNEIWGIPAGIITGGLILWACSGAQVDCAKYGTLEAEYATALQRACGNLMSEECMKQRPGAVEGVDERFRPQFEEAESCQR